jgi:hypothetical protein
MEESERENIQGYINEMIDCIEEESIFSMVYNYKPLKRVQFDNVVCMRLIPSRSDIHQCNLQKDLWLNNSEFNVIRSGAIREYTQYMTFNRFSNKPKKTMKNLWYDLDFDEIYNIIDNYKLNKKIELKKMKELYTEKIPTA